MKILLIGSIVCILEMRIGSYFSHLRCPQTPSRHELVFWVLYCDYLGITEAAFLGPREMPRLTLGLWQVFLHDTGTGTLDKPWFVLKVEPKSKEHLLHGPSPGRLPCRSSLQEAHAGSESRSPCPSVLSGLLCLCPCICILCSGHHFNNVATQQILSLVAFRRIRWCPGPLAGSGLS